MLKKLREFLTPAEPELVEGLWADQYQEEHESKLIRERYRERWPDPQLNPTPHSHPWLFDPCNPPIGWRYDPYYEIWVKDQ